MAKYDNAELVATLQRRGLVPNNQPTFTTTEFLLDCSQEMDSVLVPKLLKSHAEFFVAIQPYSITEGEMYYRVPARAIGNKLRFVRIVAVDGSYRTLEERDPKDVTKLGLNELAYGNPQFYVFEAGNIVLYPTPSSTNGDTLQLGYYCRPGRLVPTTTVGIISSFNGDRTVVTLTGSVSAFTGITSFDIVRATNGFETLAMDKAGTYAAGVVTFSSAVSSIVSAGDQICLPGEAGVPQVPSELHICIGLRGAAASLKALGDLELADKLVKEAEAKEKEFFEMIAPRNDAGAKDLTNDWWF